MTLSFFSCNTISNSLFSQLYFEPFELEKQIIYWATEQFFELCWAKTKPLKVFSAKIKCGCSSLRWNKSHSIRSQLILHSSNKQYSMLSQFLWFNFWQSWKKSDEKTQKIFQFWPKRNSEIFRVRVDPKSRNFFRNWLNCCMKRKFGQKWNISEIFSNMMSRNKQIGKKKLYSYLRLKTCHGRDLQFRWVASWVEIQFGTLKNKMEVSSFEFRLDLAI